MLLLTWSIQNFTMGIHFYSTSPCRPSEQAGRLKPASHLLQVGICSIVYAEDALSIIHRVLTCLFDQHLLLQKSDLQRAVKCLCSAPLSYERCLVDEEKHWKDYPFINPDTPHAFRLNEDTYLLKHNDPPQAQINVYSYTLNYLGLNNVFLGRVNHFGSSFTQAQYFILIWTMTRRHV
jgi:hypothetical protein